LLLSTLSAPIPAVQALFCDMRSCSLDRLDSHQRDPSARIARFFFRVSAKRRQQFQRWPEFVRAFCWWSSARFGQPILPLLAPLPDPGPARVVESVGVRARKTIQLAGIGGKLVVTFSAGRVKLPGRLVCRQRLVIHPACVVLVRDCRPSEVFGTALEGNEGKARAKAFPRGWEPCQPLPG